MAEILPKTEQDGRSPLGWCEYILRLKTEDGERIARVAVSTSTARAGKMRTERSIPIDNSVDAAELLSRLENEICSISARFIWATAWFKGAKNPASSRPWENEQQGQEDEDYVDASDPNSMAAAIVRQAVRFNAQTNNRSDALVGQVLRYFSDKNAHAHEQELKIMAERANMIEVYRELRLGNVEEKEKNLKSGAIVESISNITDAIAYKLTGGKVAGNTREQLIMRALKRFGANVTEEQAQMLGQILTPDQLTMLEALTTDPEATAERMEDELREQQQKAAAIKRKKMVAAANAEIENVAHVFDSEPTEPSSESPPVTNDSASSCDMPAKADDTNEADEAPPAEGGEGIGIGISSGAEALEVEVLPAGGDGNEGGGDANESSA